jgi:hypothetical protein
MSRNSLVIGVWVNANDINLWTLKVERLVKKCAHGLGDIIFKKTYNPKKLPLHNLSKLAAPSSALKRSYQKHAAP